MSLQILEQAFDIVRRVGLAEEIVDVAIVAFVLYHLLRLVRGTRAAQLVVGLVVLSAVGVVANLFHLLLLQWLFRNAAPFVVIAVIVLFQPELRRALDQVGRIGTLGRPLTGFNPEVYRSALQEVIRAAELLSARRTGALIVFEREVGLEDFVATGVRLNAQLSGELLQSIFFPNSPLHDGAVIIRGNRILAANCVLPMPEEGTVRERFGTRHRAALALSLVSDALVVVVSEETGSISVAENGSIKRNLDAEALRSQVLGSLSTPVGPIRARPLLGWLR